ncbi:MAG: hypothetical protein O2851_06455 [Proteobacteria bacterium]|nr:hypothetical protein [Pseudomonadota bacterium]
MIDQRTPSPPFGYSRLCHYDHDDQVRIVALYAANKIRPPRIAYREGIDIALVEALIAGEVEQDRFASWLDYYRKERRRERLQQTRKLIGSARFEQEARIEQEIKSDPL